jgi:hypothetical protein
MAAASKGSSGRQPAIGVFLVKPPTTCVTPQTQQNKPDSRPKKMASLPVQPAILNKGVAKSMAASGQAPLAAVAFNRLTSIPTKEIAATCCSPNRYERKAIQSQREELKSGSSRRPQVRA